MMMCQPIQVQNDKHLTRFCTPPGLPALNPQTVGQHLANAHWMLLNSNSDNVVARCSLWWQNVPPYPDQQLGLIGHYAAHNVDAASQLLQLACNQLAKQECTMAIGPIDGNTWRPYRLITQRGNESPFFLEPDNPDDWPIHFTHNGFSVLAEYMSALNPNLAQTHQDLSRIEARAASRGITIRSFNSNCFETELRQLYPIALTGFSRNFLYTPLAEAEFMAMYRSLQAYIQPGLILIAEKKGHPIGFVFALPNLLQTQRGQPIDTIIIKTVAVHPDYQMGGVGSLLVARCQEIADRLGYKRAIHALMHQTNNSRKISHRHSTHPIRRYALFAKGLL